MKLHGRFLRVVSRLLLPVSLVWLLAATVRPGMAQHSFVTAQETETETCISVSGLIVRDEILLTTGAPFRAILPAEGEKVSSGQAIAVVSDDAAVLQEQSRISSLNQLIQRLTLASNTDPADANRAIQALLSSLAASPRTAADRNRLKGLILRLNNDSGQLRSALTAALTEHTALTGSCNGKILTSPESGWFSSCTDGWEQILNPDMLADISAETLFSLRPAPVSRYTYGKLIQSETWYFVTQMPLSDFPDLQPGQSIVLSFPGTESDLLSMTVERSDFQSSGQVLLILSCDRISGLTVPLRNHTAVLHLNTDRGLRIPRSAVHINSSGQTGVYVREGAAAQWKQVTILDTNADYCIAALDLSTTDNLWPGDEILLGSNLYDGKVVYP